MGNVRTVLAERMPAHEHRWQLTCPSAFAPAVQTRPLEPTRIECVRPHAALTKRTPGGAPSSCGARRFGAFSDTYSTEGTPSADAGLRPKTHAAPSRSSAIAWHADPDVCSDVTLTLLSERRMCGSSRSGCLYAAGAVGVSQSERPRTQAQAHSRIVLFIGARASSTEAGPARGVSSSRSRRAVGAARTSRSPRR
jgi:hypothetical protein